MSKHDTAARLSELLMLIGKQPRTTRDVCEVLGRRPTDQTIYTDMHALHDNGLIYVSSFRRGSDGPAAAVYSRQPEPFQFEDVTREALAA